jgi:ABC-type Zn2+ transport system substrate-binding protein/surface adhesin
LPATQAAPTTSPATQAAIAVTNSNQQCQQPHLHQHPHQQHQHEHPHEHTHEHQYYHQHQQPRPAKQIAISTVGKPGEGTTKQLRYNFTCRSGWDSWQSTCQVGR